MGMRRESGLGGEAEGARRGGRVSRRTDVDPLRLAVASCRHAVSRIARGRLGATTAEELVKALAGALSRGLPDISGSATEVFAALVGLRVLDEMPCLRVRGAALRLLSEVTPLVAAHGSRRWNLWLATAMDRRGSVFAELCAQTPRCLLVVGEARAEPEVVVQGELAFGADPSEALREQLDEARAQLADALAERDAARERLDEEVQRARALAAEYGVLRSRADELERQVARGAADGRKAAQEREGVIAERDGAVRRAEKQGEQLAAKDAEIGRLQRSAADLLRERDEARKTLYERASELEALYRVILGELAPFGSAARSVEGVQNWLADGRQFLQAEHERAERLDAELKAARTRVETLTAELREERARVARENVSAGARELEKQAEEVDRLRWQLTAATRERDEVKRHLKEANERAEEAKTALDATIRDLRAQIEVGSRALVELARDVVELDAELQMRRRWRSVKESDVRGARQYALDSIKTMNILDVLKMLTARRKSR